MGLAGKNWSMWRTTTVDPNNAYADGRFRFVYMTWILADVVDQERHTQIRSAMTITIRTYAEL